MTFLEDELYELKFVSQSNCNESFNFVTPMDFFIEIFPSIFKKASASKECLPPREALLLLDVLVRGLYIRK